jgi:hypothetical protein
LRFDAVAGMRRRLVGKSLACPRPAGLSCIITDDTTMEISVRVKAPQAAAWELLTDTRRWPDWGPSIAAVSCAARYVGPGVAGWVTTFGGLRLPFRITEFTPGCSWRWRVAGIPATGHRVEPLGPACCRVIFEAPLWATPYLAVCRLAAERIKRILEEDQQ